MNRKTLMSINLCSALLLLSQSVFAGNISIVPLPNVPLPQSVKSGQTVVAYFTVTNRSSSITQSYQVVGLPSTAAQDISASNYYTSDPICGSPINLAPGASCLLQIDITGPISQKIILANQSNASQSAASLNVTTAAASNTPTLALVTQYNAGDVPIQACAINPVSGALENCHSAGGGSVFVTATVDPQGITIGNSGSTAFITTANGSGGGAPYVYQCPIYANTGMLGTCTLTHVSSSPTYQPYYGFLTLNSTATAVYLASYSSAGPDTGQVFYCPVNGGIVNPACTDTGALGVGSDPVGIVLNNTNNYGFVGSYDSWITTCAVDGSGFSSCINKTGAGSVSFREAVGLAVNNNTSTLYVADSSTSTSDYYVYGCDISTVNLTSTSFNSCYIAYSFSGYPWGITVSAANNMAYVTDYGPTIQQCSIAANGTFSTCIPNASFTGAVDIAVM